MSVLAMDRNRSDLLATAVVLAAIVVSALCCAFVLAHAGGVIA